MSQKVSPESMDDMRPEYDFSQGVRGTLSLAAPGDRIGVDVPSIVVRAAVAAEPARAADARTLVAFLGSEPGQKAFAACKVLP